MSPASKTADMLMFVGARDVAVMQQPVPELGPGDVCIKTICSGISAGTEMNVYRDTAPQLHAHHDEETGLFQPAKSADWGYPLAYGYANVGRVEACGPGVEDLAPGDLVFSFSPHGSIVVAPSDYVVPLRDLRDARHGIFYANLNTALNGVLDARISIGDVVVVSGLGVIGLLVVQLARRSGAKLVVGVDGVAHRRAVAEQLGADVTFEPGPAVAAEVRARSGNRGADVVVEVSGAPPALHEAIRTAGRDGLVVAMSWYGGTFDSLTLSGEFHHNRVRIHSSQVDAVNPDLGPLWSAERRARLALDLLHELEFDALLTHEFSLEQAPEAYRMVDGGAEGLVQCLLTYEPKDA